MNVPLVTVFLTSYNHEKYLREAIDSVLNQTFTDYELILSDDASDDASWEIIESYDDPRIIKIRHEYNYGYQLISELSGFRGKYVAIHHSDDAWESDKLEKQVAFLESHAEYAACFTRVKFIDEDSMPYELTEGNFHKNGFAVENRSKETWLNYFFFKGNCLCHPSLLIRREAYDNYDLLANKIGMLQMPDFMMWICLCMEAEIYIYPEELTKFRLRRNIQENISTDKPETHIRSQYEYYKVMRLFAQIVDKEYFLQIFPQAKKYLVNGEINTQYALANMLLDGEIYSGWLLGLDLLFASLNDENSRKELRELYGFGVKEFGKLAAEKDVFNVRRNMRFLHSHLYIDIGDGKGINGENIIENNVYLRGDNTFYVSYDVSRYNKILALRFDPTDTCIFMKLEYVKLDGKTVNWKPCNSNLAKEENGVDRFYTNDPQYNVEFEAGKINLVEICGRVDELGNEVVFPYLQEIQSELSCIKASRSYGFIQAVKKIFR